MAYDRAKVEATAAAAGIIRRAGYDGRFEDDMAGYRIAIRRPGEHLYLFLDGYWDAEGTAPEGSLIGQDLAFGRIEDGDLEGVMTIPTTYSKPIEWADPADIAAAILAAVDAHEGR